MMRDFSLVQFGLVLVSVCLSPVATGMEDSTLIWASHGAGFRAEPILMGTANLFRQAGLINATSSRFASIATASSASWFSSQLFYSPKFFERVVLAEDPHDLYDFSIEWISAYGKVYQIFGDLRRRGWDSGIIDLFAKREFSLYMLIENTLEIASREYGDPGFTTRPATPENRVSALRNTDLLIAMSLHVTTRTKNGLGWRQDSITYLGPSNSDHVFTTPMAYQYAVKKNSTFYMTGVEGTSLPLRTCVTPNAPRFFFLKDWGDFNLFPQNRKEGSLLLPMSIIPECVESGNLSEPFGGNVPSASQIALVGAAVGAEYSPLAPSSFSQAVSVDRDEIESSDSNFIVKRTQELLLSARANVVWNLADRQVDVGICLQTPNECGIHDGFASHTGINDAAALGLSVGQHHSIDKGDKDKVLKIIMSIHADNNNGFLAYFSTSFNQGVAPGGYLWPPHPGKEAHSNPWRSVQIFREYLDQERFDALRVPVTNTILSTIRLNATTIDNPTMHVQSGQKVQILVIIINKGDNSLPVMAFGPINKVTFGEVARDIATSRELLKRIKDFIS